MKTLFYLIPFPPPQYPPFDTNAHFFLTAGPNRTVPRTSWFPDVSLSMTIRIPTVGLVGHSEGGIVCEQLKERQKT